MAEANLRERKKEAAAAEAIVEQEVREFLDWRRSLDVVPLVAELRRRADEIRKAEIEKARQRLGPLTPEQESALEAATSAIVNKLLHAPTVHLKELARQRARPTTSASSGGSSACEPAPDRDARQRARALAGATTSRRGSRRSGTPRRSARSRPPATGCRTSGSRRSAARAPS